MTQQPNEPNELDQFLAHLYAAPNDLRAVVKRVHGKPDEGSTADQEMKSLTENATLRHYLQRAHVRAEFGLQASHEAVEGVSRLLQLPPVVFMPGPVVRAGIEAAGVALWLMDRSIDVDTRIKRSIGAHKSDLDYELGLTLQGAKSSRPEHRQILEDGVKWAKEQQDQFRTQTAGLSYARVPTDNELAKLCDADYEYYLYTNLAHGAPFAIRAIRGMYEDRQKPESAGAAFFGFASTPLHAHCLASWAYASYMMVESELGRVQDLLESIYDRLHFTNEPRAYFRRRAT